MTEPIKFELTTKIPDHIDQVLAPYFLGTEIDNSWIPGGVIGGFSGKHKEIYQLLIQEQQREVFLLGLGEEHQLQGAYQTFRHFIVNEKTRIRSILLVDLRHLPESAIYQCVLGISLSDYSVGVYKTENDDSHLLRQVHLLINQKSNDFVNQINEAQHSSEVIKSACALVDAPGNVKTPRYLAQWALESGKSHGYTVEILDHAALKQQNLHALLAVGRGSEHQPVLIKVVYKHPDRDSTKIDLGLVGKGVTFDTGGLSLKKPANMHYMKSDMGGAAAVLGAIELIARLQLSINVAAIIPVTENSVDSLSIRPGDVIQSHAGKSIEVIDTDAEGRLILADALSYIQDNYHPDVLIDLATLTGSCVATLGYEAAGLFTNDNALADSISQAGDRTRERVWRLPLWESYQDALYSDIADVKNLSGKPVAGAITAAKFLEFFIKEKQKWAHLDIAGVAFGDTGHAKMKSATGYGVRLLVDFARSLIST